MAICPSKRLFCGNESHENSYELAEVDLVCGLLIQDVFDRC